MASDRSHRILAATLAASLCGAPAFAALAGTVHHDLDVRLDPHAAHVAVLDRVTLAPGVASEFELAAALVPDPPAGARLVRLPAGVPGVARYRVSPAPVDGRLTLRYEGALPDRIGADGAVLSGADAWYPDFVGSQVSFTLHTVLPPGWLSVSQGRRVDPDTWSEPSAQQVIHLIAAPFVREARGTSHAEAEVYLRRADPVLAARYLDATERYLGFYAGLLGPYPYAKFALVENTAQTGYGMASFTLLGSRVIRLPFIPDTSYPHEIVHSWLGNGVYVDPRRGNWSEGLTAYLADHLGAERRGSGAAYRRASLQRYASYVAAGRDFPLTAFRARHDRASQAVGYGKAMMLAHMMRRRLGDAAFVEALRAFTARWMHRPASFDDLRAVFEAAGGEPLGPFFDQWLEREGAPHIALAVRADAAGGAVVTLTQTQRGATYLLDVPLVLTGEDGRIDRAVVSMRDRELEWRVPPGGYQRIAVDPDFDLFRRLAPGELPPSIGELLGRGEFDAIVSPGLAPALDAAHRALATALGARTVRTGGTDALAGGVPRLVLGWDDRVSAEARAALAAVGVSIDSRAVAFGEERVERGAGECVAVAYRVGGRSDGAPGLWIGCDDAAALGALARKLPHYNRYGLLIFSGARAVNRARIELPVGASPLSVDLPTGAPAPAPAPRVDPALGAAPAPGVDASRAEISTPSR